MPKQLDATNRDRQARFREARKLEELAAAAARTREIVRTTSRAAMDPDSHVRQAGLPDAPGVPLHHLSPELVCFLEQLHQLFLHAEIDPTFDGSDLCYLAFPNDVIDAAFPDVPEVEVGE